jgi:hypothetical protein
MGMARELPARFGITPHATRRTANRQIFVGVALAALGAISISFTGIVGALFGALGLLLAGLGAYTRGAGPSAQVINKAYNLASAGRVADAAELLDYAEETVKNPAFLRVIDIQRATLALRKGALEEALARADAAIARPLRLLTRDQERIHIASARGLRAVLRASTGDAGGARDDVDEVRRSPDAAPDALARAELATAILLERSGGREALRDHLVHGRRVLLEHTHPRERAIVRAYQRMLEAKATSVYREPAPREPAPGDEPALADWIARIAPAAAPFVRAPAPSTGGVAAAPGTSPPADPAARAAAESRAKLPSTSSGSGQIVLRSILLALLILPIWMIWSRLSAFLPASEVHGELAEPDRAVSAITAFGTAIALFFPAFIAFAVARGQRHTRRLVAALAALARDDEARAVPALEELGRCRTALVAAQAYLALSGVAVRRAHFDEALRRCEAGLARLHTQVLRAYASDIALPALLAERAYLFAMTDRSADARAELDLLGERYPSFPYLAGARLRVRLALAARQGDVAGAAAFAEQTADVHLTRLDELLADLARAAARPETAGAGEVDRLKAELRTDAEARRWMEAVAPAVLAAFAATEQACAGAAAQADAELGLGAQGALVATRSPDAEMEAEAEAEAEAQAAAGIAAAPALRA